MPASKVSGSPQWCWRSRLAVSEAWSSPFSLRDSMASIGGQGMPSGWPWLLALLYAIGLVVWLDRTAFVLRLSGWVLIAAALVVPLTLTPVLPVVAAMVVTIASIPSGRDPQRVPLGTPRTAVRGALRASAVTSGSEQPGECPRRGAASQQFRRRAKVRVSARLPASLQALAARRWSRGRTSRLGSSWQPSPTRCEPPSYRHHWHELPAQQGMPSTSTRPSGARYRRSGDRREYAWAVAGWGLDSVHDVRGPGVQPCRPAVAT
jgi:hypothetical protein